MDWREKIAKMVGLMTEGEVSALVETKVREARQSWIAYDTDFRQTGTAFYDTGERRESVPVSHAQMIETASNMYITSGFIKRFCEDIRNFVIGEGVSYEVDSEDKTEQAVAKEVLDDFWNDTFNKMDIELPRLVESLALLGEQCYPVEVNKINGKVWLSYLDPALIQEVHTVLNFPKIVAAVQTFSATEVQHIIPAIRQQTDYTKNNYGRLDGDCFYFAVNKLPNMPRGYSYFTPVFDFIKRYENNLKSENNLLPQRKAFIWQCKLAGATKEEIDELQRNAPRTLNTGSILYVNDQAEWSAVSPNLNAADSRSHFDTMKDYIAAALNIPASWLGSGGKAYKTESEMMNRPTFKFFADQQRYWKYILEYILRFVIDQAVKYKTLKNIEYKVTVNMPKIEKDDKQKVGMVDSISKTLTVAQRQGWISEETSSKIFAFYMSQTGFDIDPEAESEKSEKDKRNNEMKDYEKKPFYDEG